MMTGMTFADTRVTPKIQAFAVFNIIAGMIGWFASFELLTEYIKTLQNPTYVPNCAVSVLVTCGPNMASTEGAVFGFSNTIIGVSAFVAPIAVGVALLAGARFAPWFWYLYQAGLLFGFGFILWLATKSVFVLGTLCPWCMVVWTVMIPLWWVGLLRPHAIGDTRLPTALQRLFSGLYAWSWVLIFFTYLLIAIVAQVQLDWFGEFRRM